MDAEVKDQKRHKDSFPYMSCQARSYILHQLHVSSILRICVGVIPIIVYLVAAQKGYHHVQTAGSQNAWSLGT
jgi:hypothetical protein